MQKWDSKGIVSLWQGFGDRVPKNRIRRLLSGETPRWGFPSLIAPQSNSPFPAFGKEKGISRSAERDQSAQYGKPMSLQANSPLKTAIFREKSSKAFILLRALHLFYHGIPKGISYPLARFGAELHYECIADTTFSYPSLSERQVTRPQTLFPLPMFPRQVR